MKKKVLASILAAVMALSVAACGGGAASSAAEAPKEEASSEAAAPESEAAPAESEAEPAAESEAEPAAESEAAPAAEGEFNEKYNWSLSTTYAGASVVVQMYNRFAELANEYTNGAVTITVFPDGTIATEDDAIAQVSSGELEFCGTGTGPIFTFSPEEGWLNSPFMVTDVETYKNVYSSPYWEAIKQKWVDEHNFLDLCGPFYRGMRTLVSVKEVKNASDLNGLKLRMNSSKLWNDAWQAAGATTVPVSLQELYQSFQSGVVEACENPLSESGNLNITEVAKYVCPTNHVCECAGIFMAANVYNELPENYQKAIYQAGVDAMAECEPLIADEEAMWLQKYLDAGAVLVEDFDVESFRTASEEYWKQMFGTEWSNISYDDAMALIESCKP